MKFADREAAGRQLATKLAHLKERRPVVLALPRGGVAVGFEIARALSAPLDIVLVRKIGVPWQPELALGAITDGASPETFIDQVLAKILDIPESYVQEETARQLEEIERRRESYCAGRPPIAVSYQTDRGPVRASFTGILLWSLIEAAGGIDDSAKSPELRHAIRISAKDGYVVVTSTGEIAPDFGAKGAIVAYARDGKPLDDFRIVMPGDKHGGRNIRDVVSINIE